MPDRYLQDLKELERRSKDNIMSFSTVLTKRLDELAQTMIHQKMSDNDYIKLCELYYQRYERENNKTGMTFCILRIQQFLLMKKSRKNRSAYPRISFSRFQDEDTLDFLQDKKNYYRKLLNDFKKKLIVCALIFTILFMMILILLLHVRFLSGWIFSICIGIIVYYIGWQYLYVKIFDIRMSEMRKKLALIHNKVDKSITEV